MSRSSLPTLSHRLDCEGEDDLPPVLQDSLKRHRENLASMVAALRAAGLDEVNIESHLSMLIESYRLELSKALHHLGRAA